MAAIDFPNSPTLNQLYTVAGVTWQWDGAKWIPAPGPSWFSDAPNDGTLYGRQSAAWQHVPLLSSWYGFQNKFRNPMMGFWQRPTTGTVSTSGQYVADGWIALPSGAAATWSRTGPSAGVPMYALQITGAAGNTGVVFRQRIESIDAVPMSSQNVTVQAKIWNGTGATITPTLSIGHPTTIDTYASVGAASLTNEISAATLQSCPTGQWTTVAYTFAASANLYLGLEVNFNCGPVLASQTVQISAADIRATPGVATGLNSSPPSPEFRPVGTEAPRNLRYLWQPMANGVGGARYASGFCDSTTLFLAYFQFPVPMRITPTINLCPPTSLQTRFAGGLTAVGTNISSSQASPWGCSLTLTVASGLTVGYGGILTDTGGASYIQVTAEL